MVFLALGALEKTLSRVIWDGLSTEPFLHLTVGPRGVLHVVLWATTLGGKETQLNSQRQGAVGRRGTVLKEGVA